MILGNIRNLNYFYVAMLYMATEIKDGMYTNLPTPWAGDFTGTHQTRESTVRSAGHGRSANVYLVLSASQKRWAVGLQTKKSAVG